MAKFTALSGKNKNKINPPTQKIESEPEPEKKNNTHIKPSFSSLLKNAKSRSSKRSVTFGTGLRKRDLERSEKAKEKVHTFIPLTVQQQKEIAHQYETHVKEIEEEQKIKTLKLHKAPLDIVLDEYQSAALEGLTYQQYGVLIGAAGTGKTTVTRHLIQRLEDEVSTIDLRKAWVQGEEKFPNAVYGLSIAFCALTGRAVQQLKRVLSEEYHSTCSTIHALLGYMPTYEPRWDKDAGEFKETMIFRPTFTAANKLPYEIIIVDEASMVPVWLWNELMDALHPDTRIFLIGDINQLRPVQGRSVLGFAMLKWPTYTLEKIHRQAQDNAIIVNAHKILHGKLPQKHPKQFILSQLEDGSISAYRQVMGVIKKLSNGGVFDPLRDALIVPQNKDTLGKDHLNENLVHFFNPPKKDETGAVLNPRITIATGVTYTQYAVGDKVMILQNDRERGLTNGMTGLVTSIHPNGLYKGASVHQQMQRFDGDLNLDKIQENLISSDTKDEDEKEKSVRQASHVVTVTFSIGETTTEIAFHTAGHFRQLTLAYAITCHKSQGGEYPTVVIVCHSSNIKMLTREWLYTAVTRAQERVILLHNDRGLAQAVNVQSIKGKTVEEKARQFLDLQDKTDTTLPTLPEPRKV